MKKLRKIWALFVCLCMAIALLPLTAMAANVDEIWVNGVNIVTAASNTLQCGGGKAIYDPSSKKLTLNNATIDQTYEGPGKRVYGIFVKDVEKGTQAFEIVLEGDNTIDVLGGGIIDWADCGLTISGNGTLKVRSTSPGESGTALYCVQKTMGSQGDLIIDGATLDLQNSATNGGAIEVTAIDLTVKNGADITVREGTAIGMSAGNISILDSRVKIASVKDAINGSKSLTIDNSLVETESFTKIGLFARDGGISIANGSSITATAAAYFSAIQVQDGGDIVISNSTLKDIYSAGGNALYSTEGNIVISGDSELTARAKLPALYAAQGIKISGGRVNAVSSESDGMVSAGAIEISGTADVTTKSETNYCGLWSNSGTVTVTGGSLTAVGGNTTYGAIGRSAPDLSGYIGSYSAVASENTDGSSLKAYSAAENDTYQYIRIAPHTHDWASSWSRDATHHWHDCNAPDCDVLANAQKNGYVAHVYDQEIAEDAYKAGEALYYRSCVCGLKGTDTFPYGKPENHIDSGPQTGDSGGPAFWALLLVFATGGVTGTTIYTKKKKAR